MAGAADTVLAIGQQQQRSLEFLGNSITNGFQQLSLAQQNRANAAQEMFKSALDYKQQQIDTYFKEKNLELQNRQLEIETLYKQGMLDYHMRSLDMQRDFKAEELRLKTLDEKQKLAVGSLQKSAATLSAQRLALAASMDANKNVIKELENSLMSGNGNVTETERALEAAKNRHSQFEEKFNLLGQQAELYGLKIAAASNGVPLEELSSFDSSSTTTSSTPQNFVSVFKDDGGYPTLPTSQPSQQLPFLKPSKSIRVPKSIIPPDDIEPVKQVEKPSNQITWDQFQKYYLGADEKDRPGITYKMSQRLDEDGKKKLQDISKSLEYNYLQNLGETKNYGIFNKNRETDDSLLNKRMEETSATYAKLNGTTGGLDDLHRKAGDFFRRINDPSTEIGKSVLGPPDPEDETYRPISPVKAADAYNKFINDLLNPQVEEKDTSIFKDGVGMLVAPSGATLNFGNAKKSIPFSSAQPDNPISFINQNIKIPLKPEDENFVIPKKFEENPAKVRQNEVEAAFNKDFINNGKLDKKKFALWAQNALSNEDLGIAYVSFDDNGEQVVKFNDTLNKERENKIIKAYQDKKEALKLFEKKYGK